MSSENWRIDRAAQDKDGRVAHDPHDSELNAHAGGQSSATGYYEEVKANPGPPAVRGDYYDDSRVKADLGRPAAKGDYYDDSKVKADLGRPAARGDYYDDSRVKANPGPPAHKRT